MSLLSGSGLSVGFVICSGQGLGQGQNLGQGSLDQVWPEASGLAWPCLGLPGLGLPGPAWTALDQPGLAAALPGLA